MEMISPEAYIESIKSYSIDKLENEKLKLKSKIEKIKEDIANNVFDIFNGGRDTKLKMYENYLQELEKIIEEKTIDN